MQEFKKVQIKMQTKNANCLKLFRSKNEKCQKKDKFSGSSGASNEKLKYLKNIQVHQFKNEIKTRLMDLSELVFQINQII